MAGREELVDINDYIVVREEDGINNIHDEHVVELGCGRVTVKALGWLKRKYVEMLGDSVRITNAKLVEVLMEWGIDVSEVDSHVESLGSFLQFLAVIQRHKTLRKKVQELTKWYTYSDVAAYEHPYELTMRFLREYLVKPGSAWSFTLAELEDVVRLFESGDNQIDDDLVIENIIF